MNFIKDTFVAFIGFVTFALFGLFLVGYYPFYVLKNFEEQDVRNGFYNISIFVMKVVKFISKSFVVEFKEKDLDCPCIVVANHSSILDIVVFCSLNFKNAVFLSTGWPTKIPLMNKYLKATGNIIFDANTSFDEICSLVKTAFSKNLKVIIFPEGTRSEDGTVKRFHKGAFLIAQKLGVPILPVAIKGLDKTIRKNSIIVKSCDIKITVLNKIFIREESQVLDITKKTRQIIAEEKEK
jgi:1-acyl-sn-glycerol-3-phosphate acyltransferase